MDLGTFRKKIKRQYKLLTEKMKLSKSRKASLKIIHGIEVGQYN